MKKLFAFILSLVTCAFSLVPAPALAHMIGQQPFFTANGVFTEFYPVPSTSLADFKLPQDIAKEIFLLNQPVEFEIVLNALPVPPEVVKKTKFNWEFGDGAKAEGLKNLHSYSKPGTYFLEIYADSGEGFEPQLLQSTAINVVPDKNYQLPKAVIQVNGKQSKDPLLDILDVDFSGYIDFNASKSNPGSSQITEYAWDLGDQTARNEVTFKYQYKENPYTVFPVLRIKTKDGFIADSFIQIKDEKAFSESSVKPLIQQLNPLQKKGTNWLVIIAAAVALGIVVAIIFIISKLQPKKRKF